MADNRFNQVPGYGGGGRFQFGQQNAGVHGVPGVAPYMQAGVPMSPMMQQQIMMASGMRFPIQGMRMGPPNNPPPPYNLHSPNSVATSLPNRPRTSLNKSKGGQQSEKERFFEEQRQKLKQYGKPGAAKVDANKLIGSIFGPDTKPQPAKGKTLNKTTKCETDDEDDGFGDFLQASASDANKENKKTDPGLSPEPLKIAFPEPAHQQEKKDLKSMMLEYSDLSAPKKAKGFHKPTLNEVQKSGHGHHKMNTANFHESDHSRSWKKNADDLEGLFQLPVNTKPTTPVVASAAATRPTHVVYAPHHVMSTGLPLASVATCSPGSVAIIPPSGPPPVYSSMGGSQGLGASPILVASNHSGVPVNHPCPNDPTHRTRGQLHLPEWCSYNEEQVPPVYKQVLEASLVNNKISTERLYPILLLSDLPREKLAQIWSLCNTATPGQLVKNEMWMVLALIALTQNNYNTNSLDILANCSVAPVPKLTPNQDAIAPATLPTTPQQHLLHPAQHTAAPVAATAVATPPFASSASGHSHHQHQQHQVQHPRPQLATSGTVANINNATLAEDDNFADFQTAAPVAHGHPVSVTKVFGEFIGGGSSSSYAAHGYHSSSPPTLPIYTHVGNGSVVMGHGHPHLHQHQQLQQQQQPPPTQQLPSPQQPQPAQLSLGSLPVDDKYGNNVRSFFCSSDSSTGHTSPSFEDDDLTDDRGSLSQVSTSEQSENEDLRNFETYVEEFHQKKEQPDSGSPLHCPFPAIQQNQAMKPAKGPKQGTQPVFPSFPPDLKNVARVASKITPLNQSSLTSAPLPGPFVSAVLPPASGNSIMISSLPDAEDFTDFKSAPMSSNNHSVLDDAASILSKYNTSAEDDFADFKSASLQTSNTSSSIDVSLMGDEDKYGALRVLDTDSDFSHSTVFENHTSAATPGDPSIKQDSSQDNGGDDWADFSAAVCTEDTPDIQPSAMAGPSTGVTKSSNKEDILKLFHSGSSSKTPSLFTSGNSSDVTSEGGSKNGSLFGDGPSSSSTPSKEKWKDSLSGDLPLSSSFTDPDPRQEKLDVTGTENWPSYNSKGGDESYYNSSDHFGQAASLNDSSVNKLSASGYAITAGLASPVATAHRHDNGQQVQDKEEEWGDFSASSQSCSTPHENHSQNVTGTEGGSNWKPFANSDSNSEVVEEEWSDFSSAGTGKMTEGEDVEAAGERGGGGGSNGHFVTIKKQNLGTSEIMGLFKVRDDPATMSSYQLPVQSTASKNSSRHSRGSVNYGGHVRRRSSDFEDDIGPPPMDFCIEDDFDDHSFSRGYDLDDLMQRLPPATTYGPFGMVHSSPLYSRVGGLNRLKENKEDSGSVHSLDLPTAKPIDPSGSDSQSVSSADLTSSEMTGGGAGVVSAESKSLDSLDFKIDNIDSDGIDENREEGAPTLSSHHQQQQQQQHHPIQPQELLGSMPDFADKYNIDHQAQGSDRYGYQWERCLSNCLHIISEANTLFNTISSSSVCNEVLRSSQGSEYVTSIVEIYRVVCRVMTSMRSTAISTTELEQTLKNIDLAWNNLTAFLVGASLLPDQTSLVFTNALIKSDSEQAQTLACGLCLLNVDCKPLGINSCKLTYAGRQYHATCANFWVNCVDQTLPSLTLSELL